MEGDPLSEKTYNHIALKVSETDLGLEILNDQKRVHGEGKSLYFYDYDNHLFELHAGTLNRGLEAYK